MAARADLANVRSLARRVLQRLQAELERHAPEPVSEPERLGRIREAVRATLAMAGGPMSRREVRDHLGARWGDVRAALAAELAEPSGVVVRVGVKLHGAAWPLWTRARAIAAGLEIVGETAEGDARTRLRRTLAWGANAERRAAARARARGGVRCAGERVVSARAMVRRALAVSDDPMSGRQLAADLGVRVADVYAAIGAEMEDPHGAVVLTKARRGGATLLWDRQRAIAAGLEIVSHSARPGSGEGHRSKR